MQAIGRIVELVSAWAATAEFKATTEGSATFVTDKPEPKPVQGNGVFSVPTFRVTLT